MARVYKTSSLGKKKKNFIYHKGNEGTKIISEKIEK